MGGDRGDAFLAGLADLPPSLAISCDDEARAAVAVVIDAGGVVLLGETHGVVENAAALAWFVRAFGPLGVALEWKQQAVDVLAEHARGGPVDVARLRPSQDGRITPQHFSVLRHLVADSLVTSIAGFAPTAFTLPPGDPSQNAWERALADRLLAARVDDETATIAAAGSIHALTEPQPLRGPGATPVGRMFAQDAAFAGQEHFLPMGWHVAHAVPTVSIRLRYGGGTFTNFGVRPLAADDSVDGDRLRLRNGRPTVEIRRAHAAEVPG